MANLLNRVLGLYVENFDLRQLNIGIWLGAVTLKHLQLKRELLDQLGLPVDVVFGELEELLLVIPWLNLKLKPVQISVNGLYLLAVPTATKAYDEAEAKRRELAVKRQKIDQLDVLEQDQTTTTNNNEDGGGFAALLITKIIDNLQITIKNIYLRYEDTEGQGLAEDPYAFGVLLAELSAVLTDELWTPLFIAITREFTRKLLTLSQLSCYMDTGAELVLLDLADVTKSKFTDSDDRQYLLKPVLGQGKLTVHKGGATATVPHIDADVDFEEFGLTLDDRQYHDILWTVLKFEWYQRTLKYRKFRPQTKVSDDPKGWFQYAAKAVLDEIHTRNNQWTWAHFKKRRDQRQSYIEKYIAKLCGEPVQGLEELEDDLLLDDIKWYRTLARDEMKRTGKKPKPPTENQQQQLKGWFGGWFGGSAPSDTQVPGEFGLTDEQRDALYDTIDYKQDVTPYGGDDDWIKWVLAANLTRGGIAISREAMIGEMVFEGCLINVLLLEATTKAKFDLHEFRVEDGTGTLIYRHIVLVHDVQDGAECEVDEDPFLSVSYASNPKAVGCDLKLMTIFYNPQFIDEIIKFFTPPKIHLDTIGAIMSAARDGGGELLNQMTRIGLEYALDEHETVNVALDLQAPLIICPLDPLLYDLAVAIIDAGHLRVTLVPGDKDKLEEIRGKKDYGDADWNALKKLMYDRYRLELTDAQFCVGPDIRQTMATLHQPGPNPSAILERFDLNLGLGVLILPEAPQLAKVTLDGEIQQIKLTMNDWQYKTLMEIIDRAIPADDDVLAKEAAAVAIKNETSNGTANGSDSKAVSSYQVDKNQHVFELSLVAHDIEIQLGRCTDPATMLAIDFADLIGKDLKVNIWNLAAQIHVDVNLQNLKAHQGKTTLILGLVDANNTDPLLVVDYNRILRIAPWQGRDIDVWDQNIEVDISVVQFVVLRAAWLLVLNFIQNTFVNPNAPPLPSDELAHNLVDDEEAAPAKINLSVNFNRILTDFVEDTGGVVGSLKLLRAAIQMLILPEALKMKGNLGKLVLEEGEHLRELLSMDDENLVEFRYELFDPTTNKRDYIADLEVKTGAILVMFIELLWVALTTYFAQFGRMKEVYDKARDNVPKPEGDLKFDIVVNAPTVVFPKLRDLATVKLGQFYANNRFEDGHNLINAGVRDSLVSTHFVFEQCTQNLMVLENLDIAFDVDYHPSGIVVKGTTPGIDLTLTELQARYFYYISQAVQQVIGDEVAVAPILAEEIEFEAANARAVGGTEPAPISEVIPEETATDVAKDEDPKPPTPYSVILSIPKALLSLYDNTEAQELIQLCHLGAIAFTEFSTEVNLKDGIDWQSHITVKLFLIKDTRKGPSCFTEIIPPTIGDDKDQFLVQVAKEGRQLTVISTVDQPKLIISLEWVFAIQKWYQKTSETHRIDGGRRRSSAPRRLSTQLDRRQSVLGGAQRRPLMTAAHPPSLQAVPHQQKPHEEPPTIVGLNINVLLPQIVLLADPTKTNLLALVFKVEQLLVTQQHTLNVAANNIGLYLALMDQPDNMNYRIIDDFLALFSYNQGQLNASHLMTNMHLLVDPMLIKVSVKDIRLAMTVVESARAMMDDGSGALTAEVADDESDTGSELDVATIITNLLPDNNSDKVVINGEEVTALFGGIRFLLIGDVHELPVIDGRIESFEAKATNWLLNLAAEAHLKLCINVLNYSQLLWEPLIEPWSLGIYLTRPEQTLLVDVVLRNTAEVTVTLRTVALLSQIQLLITNVDEPLKPRGEDKPYLLVNHTGVPITVKGADKELTVEPWAEEQWAFEDWIEVRQLTPQSLINPELEVKFGDFEELTVSLRGEGNDIYTLEPEQDGTHLRLVCELALRPDNVKKVIFHSTITITNALDRGLKVLCDGHEVSLPSSEQISIPISLVKLGLWQIAPDDDNYRYLSTDLSWTTLKENTQQVIECNPISPDHQPMYFFVDAKYDPMEPLAQVYPHMSIIVSLPLEVENLLPVSCKYTLYDKSTGQSWKGSIDKGKIGYFDVANTKTAKLWLSVEPQDYPELEFVAVGDHDARMGINVDGNRLDLGLHHHDTANMKVSVYAPYVILNQTMVDLEISDSQATSLFILAWRRELPLLYSYPNGGDNKSRSMIRAGDTAWTEPISFELAGQAVVATARVQGKQLERNFAVSVDYGLGIYHHTKVVTITPRYVVCSRYPEPLQLMEQGRVNLTTIMPNQEWPLYHLHCSMTKLILLSLANQQWLLPFALDDVGQFTVKVVHPGNYQVLVKVTSRVEGATMFITLEPLTLWPFSFRNYTDYTFYLYQTNPNTNENGEVVKNDTVYKPIYYKLPPKLVMPYAYDYPNAIIKEVAVRSGDHERLVNLSEIGPLSPFRLGDDSVDMDVIADGPTTTFSIRPPQDRNLEDEDKQDEELTMIKVVAKFEGVGISLINLYRAQEICYITYKGLELRYNELDRLQTLSVKLKWIQVDNQLYGGVFPIVVYPLVIPKLGREINQHPLLSGLISRVKDLPELDVVLGVTFIKYATILLQELLIEIDEDFLMALLDFAKVPGALWSNQEAIELWAPRPPLPKPKDLGSLQLDVYFEALHLQPVQLNLSFMRTERVNTEGDDETAAHTTSTLMFLFNVLTMAVGNVNDAPIKLNALFIENLRLLPALLTDLISNHYAQLFFYQVHKILGSADFLGNPVGLFNQLLLGVMDIFYEPYQGFIVNDRPQEIGIGLAKGGLLFMKKLVYGISDSVAKVTGSIAKGLLAATMDTDFQELRRKYLRRNRPKHALYGFGLGVELLFDLVSLGLAGIATAPLEGAEREGAVGFFKGIGKGMIGLPTKTAIGVFDFALNFSEGIRNTTTVFESEGLDKVRMPRYIAPNAPVAPFSPGQAQGQYWLKNIDLGSYFSLVYVAHLTLTGTDMCVLVTYSEIIVFDMSTLQLKKDVLYDRLTEVLKEHLGIDLKLQGRSELFVPVSDKGLRDWLYGKIGMAVADYNTKFRVEP